MKQREGKVNNITNNFQNVDYYPSIIILKNGCTQNFPHLSWRFFLACIIGNIYSKK